MSLVLKCEDLAWGREVTLNWAYALFLRHRPRNKRNNKIQERHCWSQPTWTQALMSVENIPVSNSLKFHFLFYKMRSIQLSPGQFGGSLDLTPPFFDLSPFFYLRDLPKAEERQGHFPIPHFSLSRKHRPNHTACNFPSHRAKAHPAFPSSSLVISIHFSF